MAISIEELIKNKINIDASMNKTIKVECKELLDIGIGDGVMEFRLLTAPEWEDLQEKPGNVDNELIYSTCIEPNIKDDRLLRAFKCTLQEGKEPTDIVNQLITPGTQAEICKIIISESKLYASPEYARKIDDEIKN